jgi:hypothetical protein
VIIDNAARALRCLSPMTFAEVSTHALVARDASDEIATAARQSYMHELPRIEPRCFTPFRNPHTSTCGGKAFPS